jgi:hypothetical protein
MDKSAANTTSRDTDPLVCSARARLRLNRTRDNMAMPKLAKTDVGFCHKSPTYDCRALRDALICRRNLTAANRVKIHNQPDTEWGSWKCVCWENSWRQEMAKADLCNGLRSFLSPSLALLKSGFGGSTRREGQQERRFEVESKHYMGKTTTISTTTATTITTTQETRRRGT